MVGAGKYSERHTIVSLVNGFLIEKMRRTGSWPEKKLSCCHVLVLVSLHYFLILVEIVFQVLRLQES